MLKFVKNLIQKIISNPHTPIYFFEISRVVIASAVTALFALFIGTEIGEGISRFLTKLLFGEAVLDRVL